MWEELADLVLERALPMAVALCLSQLSRPLSTSSHDGIQDFWGLTAASGHYRTPVVLGGYFFPFFLRGFTYIFDNSYSDLRLPSLDQRSHVPDNCTETTEKRDVRLESSGWSLLTPNILGRCIPQSSCMGVFLKALAPLIKAFLGNATSLKGPEYFVYCGPCREGIPVLGVIRDRKSMA